MAGSRATRRRWIAVTVTILIVFSRMGFGIITSGMTTMSPVPHADAQFEAFKKTCTTNPAAYWNATADGYDDSRNRTL